MGSFKWFLGGAMTLIVLELVTRNDRSANAVGGMLGALASMANRFLDPTVPAIPERDAKTTTTPAAQGTTYPNPSIPNLGGTTP